MLGGMVPDALTPLRLPAGDRLRTRRRGGRASEQKTRPAPASKTGEQKEAAREPHQEAAVLLCRSVLDTKRGPIEVKEVRWCCPIASAKQ